MEWKVRKASLGALALATVACLANGEVATTVTTVVTTTTTAPLTPAEAAAEFHGCLTEEGLTVPVVPLDDNGRPDLFALADATRQNSDGWQDALTACAALIVSNGALDLSADPALAQAVTARLMAFSACMRGQGVEAFPDPPSEFDGTEPPFPVAEIPVTDPELGTAAEACALTASSAS